MKVWVYIDTSRQVGDHDHVKVFANPEAALAWFESNNPEGTATAYEVQSSLMTTSEAHDRFQQQIGRILDGLTRT